MKRYLLPGALAVAGIIQPVYAADHERSFKQGTPVVLVGVISSQPRDAGVAVEDKMQVAIGPDRVDHTLHFKDVRIVGPAGEELAKSDLKDKTWVRAEGVTMDDPRRIRVSALRVLGSSPEAYRSSSFFRTGWNEGYVVLNNSGQPRASTKPFQQGEGVVLLAPISSQPRNAGVTVENKMQVAVGAERTDYTLHLEDAVISGPGGQEMAKSDLRDRMWVRAEGAVMDDARRIKVSRLQVLSTDETGFRQSAYGGRNSSEGYIVRTADAPAPRRVRQERTRRAGRDAGRDASPTGLAMGTAVVMVGRVSSPPKGELEEKKMQVAVGPDRTDYTLHFRDAQLVGLHGQKIDEDGFNDGQWVRAEGTVMDDSRRIKATRVQVIGTDDMGFRRSAFARPGYQHGYLMTTAGVRQTFPGTDPVLVFTERPMTLVGRVSDDTGPLESTRKLQVHAAGNEWTINVPKEAMVVDGRGEKISVHEIKEGQWVRLTGWQTDDLRMRISRMENIGTQEAFRGSPIYRTDWPMGYVEYEAAVMGPGNFNFSGTVASLNEDGGFALVRDEQGKEHRIPMSREQLRGLKVGDRVNIRSTTEPRR